MDKKDAINKTDTIKTYAYTVSKFKDGADTMDSSNVPSEKVFKTLEEAAEDFLKTQGCPEGEPVVLLSAEDGKGYLSFKSGDTEVIGIFQKMVTTVTYSTDAGIASLEEVRAAAESLSQAEERA